MMVFVFAVFNNVKYLLHCYREMCFIKAEIIVLYSLFFGFCHVFCEIHLYTFFLLYLTFAVIKMSSCRMEERHEFAS